MGAGRFSFVGDELLAHHKLLAIHDGRIPAVPIKLLTAFDLKLARLDQLPVEINVHMIISFGHPIFVA